MPGHPNHLRPIVGVVGGPPILRIDEQRFNILLELRKVNLVEQFFVTLVAQGIGRWLILVKQFDRQAVGPPVVNLGGGSQGTAYAGASEWALLKSFGILNEFHGEFLCVLLNLTGVILK
jgi:hypothetical protein